MSDFGGILIDYDTVIKASVDLEGVPLVPGISPEQIEFRTTLEELAAHGYPIAYESSLDSRMLGSQIFRENLSCDGYLGESGHNDMRIDMRLESFRELLRGANKFVYVSNFANRIHVASGLGFTCLTSWQLVESKARLLANQAVKRPAFTGRELAAHIEKASARTSGLILPLLPSRLITNPEITSESRRWTGMALPTLLELVRPKLDQTSGCQYFVPYYSGEPTDLLGNRLWKRIKDWNGKESGPNPNLLDLNFVSAAMAAGLWAQELEAVTYIPSSPVSKAKPAGASIHLAKRVSEFLGLPRLDILTRSAHQSFDLKSPDKNPPGHLKIAVVDDQVTKGTSMANALDLLTRHLPNANFNPIVWSRSIRD
jgi:hypothetical protein